MKNNKPYDLEERTYLFASYCRTFIKKLPKTFSNAEDSKQLIKSSGSIAANYIEANENLGDRDLKIARKEAKESILWLKLLRDLNEEHKKEFEDLIEECIELKNILSTIINKS